MKRTNHVFIKLTALLLTVFFCATLSSCLPLKIYSIDRSCEVELDGGDVIYHGVRYVNTENYSGRLGADFSSDDCTLLGLKFSGLLMSFSGYYADDAESPTIIVCDRWCDVWLKEGLDIKDIILNNENRINEDVSFKISEVMTGDVIEYSFDNRYQYKTVYYKYCPLNVCSAFYFTLRVTSYADELYIQYAWDSDLYAITDEFEAVLRDGGFLDRADSKVPFDGAQTIAYK